MTNRIEDWAKAIEKHEGRIAPNAQYPKGTRSYRNNNSGNLRATSYTLSLGENNGKDDANFVVYKTYEIGFNALKQFLVDACTDKLRAYKSTMTLLDFYKVYAPSADNNNPLNYASDVAKQLGIGIDTKIGSLYAPDVIQRPSFVIYNQLDYKGKKFGSKKATDIADYGCKLCAVATILQKDPVEVDKILVKGGAYFGTSGDMLDDATLAKVLGWEYLGKETDIDKMPSWSPTIKEVDFSASSGKQQHFVVRIIKPDGTTAILDPYGGVERKVNYYESKSNQFVSYRLFKLPVVEAPKEEVKPVENSDVLALKGELAVVKDELSNTRALLSTANSKIEAQATVITNLEKKLSEEKVSHEETKKALEGSSGVYKLAQEAKRAVTNIWNAIV